LHFRRCSWSVLINVYTFSLDNFRLQYPSKILFIRMRCQQNLDIYPNPPCQHSLYWEKTFTWATLFTQVFWIRDSTHEFRGERHLLWWLHHRNPIVRSSWDIGLRGYTALYSWANGGKLYSFTCKLNVNVVLRKREHSSHCKIMLSC
jgi:hypothetical protein